MKREPKQNGDFDEVKRKEIKKYVVWLKQKKRFKLLQQMKKWNRLKIKKGKKKEK